jgi:hypothetical protein
MIDVLEVVTVRFWMKAWWLMLGLNTSSHGPTVSSGLRMTMECSAQIASAVGCSSMRSCQVPGMTMVSETCCGWTVIL